MVTGGHVTMPVTLDTTVKDVKIFLGQHQDRKPYYYRLLLGKKDMKVRAPDGTANKLVRYTGPQCAGVTVTAIAPYSAYAGMNTIPGAAVDDHGNAHGAAYDLGEDGAFQGLTAAVLQLSGFDFVAPRTALEEKGFTLVHWVCIPSEAEFTQALSGAFQCWVISGHSGDAPLGAGHLDSLKHFYERGGGVYLWGDNDPYFFHANVVAHTLLGPGISLEGNDWGDRHLSPRPSTKAGSGFDSNSLLFTGIAKLYEGITIARVCAAGRTGVKTIMVSSHRQPLPGVINDGRHRLIVDGGFTRLFCHWDAAGSARFVKNASAWLCGVDADWV
ncbi:hypothetical protein JKP88DRAFT_286489 [Tribonema minus]|uniref:Uncharacterized protein n=1 Tax=Tribonema minus TaxID=303371 RepID=A0A835ZA35_9STRA|nr:hypothetical protein JKP88DRAFT_286489 [Tribonema minus]